MAKSAVRRDKSGSKANIKAAAGQSAAGKKQAGAGRSRGGLKLHGDKLAHAVHEAADRSDRPAAKRGRS